MTDRPKLHVIHGSPPPDTPAEKVRKRVKVMAKPASMVQCHRCGGREVIRTEIGVMRQGGKAKKGTEQLLCAGCFMRGERVVIG